MSAQFGRQAIALVALALLPACGGSAPTQSTPPPAAHPNIAIQSLTVSGEATSNGYVYRVVVHLRETAGVVATISAVDLGFTTGTTTIASVHYDQPLQPGTTTCPATGTVDTRELVTTDADRTHPYATSVQVKVTYTDGASFQSAASATTDVPSLAAAPPPATYALAGTIRDTDTSAPIAGARVEVLNGVNAGNATTTDNAGAYTLTNLSAATFRMRASATGYDSGEQNVTVPDVVRADMFLRRTPPSTPTPCSYTVSPTGEWDVPRNGAQLNITVTRTAGACSWRATADGSWIGLSIQSGTGEVPVTLVATVGINASYLERDGTIGIAWEGGQAQLAVRQAHDTPTQCLVLVSVNGQSSTANIPATAGQYTVSVAVYPGVPASFCTTWTARTGEGAQFITLVGAITGTMPGSFAFSVPANPTHSVRSQLIFVTLAGSQYSGVVQISQAGAP